ncbi:MAG: hypothetical protein UY05_C0063G0010 [Candidatus Peregrinibacteria bacterium GW2011_GWA2_47_7]|nr:MAG: hypothetical protein UY05_C0063G0010 [Candidatus Peregrinibacteria bacterium GW2011_GWA2_47_7]
MKTLIYDPQPRRRFPLGREAVRDRGEQSIIFPDNGKPLRNFVKESFCPRDSAWFEDAERARSAVRASLVKNGYDVEERPTSDGEMRMGAGGFPVAEWELGNEAELVQGYIINGEFGKMQEVSKAFCMWTMMKVNVREKRRLLSA